MGTLLLLNLATPCRATTEIAQVVTRATEIADFFNLPVSYVLDLRQHGFGYAEISKILVISQLSGRKIDLLISDNEAGVGWGTLSRQLGLSPLIVERRVDEVRSQLHIYVQTEAGQSARATESP